MQFQLQKIDAGLVCESPMHKFMIVVEEYMTTFIIVLIKSVRDIYVDHCSKIYTTYSKIYTTYQFSFIIEKFD